MVHAFHPSARDREAEAGESRVQDQPDLYIAIVPGQLGLHSETLS